MANWIPLAYTLTGRGSKLVPFLLETSFGFLPLVCFFFMSQVPFRSALLVFPMALVGYLWYLCAYEIGYIFNDRMPKVRGDIGGDYNGALDRERLPRAILLRVFLLAVGIGSVFVFDHRIAISMCVILVLTAIVYCLHNTVPFGMGRVMTFSLLRTLRIVVVPLLFTEFSMRTYLGSYALGEQDYRALFLWLSFFSVRLIVESVLFYVPRKLGIIVDMPKLMVVHRYSQWQLALLIGLFGVAYSPYMACLLIAFVGIVTTQERILSSLRNIWKRV